MHPHLRRSRRKAFTIIEVMMAAAVMLAGIMGMIQVVVSGSEMIDVSRKQTIAAQIIHSEIDKLHLNDWTTVNAFPSSAAITINTSLQTVSTGFSCTRTVSTVRMFFFVERAEILMKSSAPIEPCTFSLYGKVPVVVVPSPTEPV